MDSVIFFAVLAAALAHALYNAVIKGRKRAVPVATEVENTTASSWNNVFGIASASGIIALVALPFMPQPDMASWPYFIFSGAAQLVYMNMVARVYAASDYATGYPLMRGMGAFFAAIAAVIILGEPADWHMMLCVGLICAGILFMAFTEITNKTAFKKQFVYAFVTCLMLAALTMIDVIGARLSNAPVTYGLWVFLLQGVVIFMWRFYRRNIPWATLRRRSNWVAGICSLFSYCIIVWAVTHAPASMVVALRESSILFSILLAAFFLREHTRRTRWIAAGMIASGVVLLRLV